MIIAALHRVGLVSLAYYMRVRQCCDCFLGWFLPLSVAFHGSFAAGIDEIVLFHDWYAVCIEYESRTLKLDYD